MLQLPQQDDLIEQMIPVAHQFFPDLLDMHLVTCLQRHRHNAGVDLGLCILAFMGNIQNVCSCFRNTGQQLCQVACLVRQFGLQLDNASGLLQALCDDARKGRDIHIASGYDNSRLERGIHLIEQISSNGRSACALVSTLSNR